MLNRSVMVIGAGSLPELLMARGCTTLAQAVGLPLCTVNVGQAPDPWFSRQVAASPALMRLCGDAGRISRDGSSWLDALGAWQIPTVVLAVTESDGAVPGIVPATIALCKARRVPLKALLQLGDSWNRSERLRDGLPWQGWLSARNDDGLDGVVALLRGQLAVPSTPQF
jgi:hypothetical protein